MMFRQGDVALIPSTQPAPTGKARRVVLVRGAATGHTHALGGLVSPVLVPAFLAVVQASAPLPVTFAAGGADDIVQFCDDNIGRPILVGDGADRGFSSADIGDLRLDLRNPAVRDAVVRAIWRKLRPEEPEPLTAPRWDNNGEGRFSLVGRHSRGVSDVTYDVRFRRPPGGGRSPECEDIVVPGLGDLPRDSHDRPQDFADRDLLALAEVAKAVLS